MRVGLIQSNYIPWRGYFDFIDDVDLFIFYDDVQYTKNDWRNRNIIKTNHGKQWLTVPVKHNFGQLIKDAEIDYSRDWVSNHIENFETFYKKSDFFDDAFELVNSNLDGRKEMLINNLNINFIKDICKYLYIDTKFKLSSEFVVEGIKTERIINILNKVGATEYLSGTAADNYLDKKLFKDNNITLEYKSYVYDKYPQLWGDFISNVTILDMISNCGEESYKFLNSKEKNMVVE